MERRFFKVRKTPTGYVDVEGSLLSCILHFDGDGTYIGQEQMNMIDDRPDAPATLFFKASGNEAGWLSLTKEEMEAATT